MSPTGDSDLLVAARGALLEALEALHAHRHAVIVIGAQAIYLHTGAGEVGLAEMTKDTAVPTLPMSLAQPLCWSPSCTSSVNGKPPRDGL